MELSLLNLLLVVAAAAGGGFVASRLGYPSVLGELIAGIIFGPALIGLLGPDESLRVLGELGILLMMLFIGMHIDLADLKRASWPGLMAAIGGFFVPAGLGYAAALMFGASHLGAAFIGLAMGVTSLATKSRILVDLKILDTRVAHVLIAGALLSDVAVLIIFAIVLGMAGSVAAVGDASLVGDIVRVVVETGLFVAVAYVIGTRVLPAAGRLLHKRGVTDRNVIFLMLVLTGLVMAEMAELAGLHAILGAFVAGLFIDDGILQRRSARDVQDLLRTISIGLLAPIFFVMAGFHVTLSVFRTDLAFLITIVVVATVGKILGTALFYLPTGFGWREGVAVGTGMNGRGAVEIIVAEIALTQGLIDETVFSILVFMALATTATVPVLLTLSVRALERRGELVRPGIRRDVVIVGAGRVARLLAHALAPTPVRLIDTNPDHAAAAAREGLDVILGSALDAEVLEAAELEKARIVITMTANPNVDVLVAQVAAGSFGVPDVHIATGAVTSTALEHLLHDAGVAPLFDRPVDLGSWDYAVASGTAHTMEIDVDRPPSDLDALRSLPVPGEPSRDVLPLVVARGDDRILFSRVDDLMIGDRVIVLSWAAGPDAGAGRFEAQETGERPVRTPSDASRRNQKALSPQETAYVTAPPVTPPPTRA